MLHARDRMVGKKEAVLFLTISYTSFLTLPSVWYSLPRTFSIYLSTCLDCELVGAGSERVLTTSLSGSLLLSPFL